jgi:hypothetical protein
MDKSMTISDMSTAATAMAKSGFFTDTHDAAQALVKIMAGSEMGFGPFASMTGVYIIQGKPSVGANLMAAAVKGGGKYDYKVNAMSDKECSITFLQNGKDIGTSTFNLEDAKKAGTKNLDKFPRNMLFARAMSNGVRWFTPDIFMGAAVYTPEELGADVNQDGDIIDLPALPAPAVTQALDEAIDLGGEVADTSSTNTGTGMPIDMAVTVTNSEGTLYNDLPTDKLALMINAMVKKNKTDKDDVQVASRNYKIAAARAIIASRATK